MSSPRALVGLAAKRALPRPFAIRHHLRHAAALSVLAGRRPVINSTLSQGPIFRRELSHGNLSDSCRLLHTTSRASRDPQQQQQQQPSKPKRPRRPRTFHLTPPQPPSVHPHSSTEPTTTLPLSEQLRTVMRLLSHSVVVCTATHPGAGESTAPAIQHSAASSSSSSASPSLPSHPTPRAMTMSSFTSLALAPTPLVSFNIAVPSRTLDAVATSKRFNVHVLADDAAGASLADWFAGGNADPDTDPDLDVAGNMDGAGAGPRRKLGVFDRLVMEGAVRVVNGCGASKSEGDPSAAAAPILEGDGVLYVLRCRLLEDGPSGGLVRVRDHVIVLGEVLEIIEGTGAHKETDKFGLLYADRRYRQLGQCIAPKTE
ncbi:hypothetical protein VTJ83DRAFT_3951 [Remersonia thermophila]|uniref:Flavin reductase like domain-containing protein n=1 Tax=Remersonia thermophila TaxID=72144 RepID=A0ABR4DFH8_9PEZI